MPRIVFGGKVYNNEFEMPADIRQAYQEKQKQEKNNANKKPLTDIVDMAPEVKKLYERALGRVEEQPTESKPLNELPNTEDIYRQSAPQDMKHLPSAESVYQPSKPIIDPMKSTIEPELGISRFITSIVWAFILVAIAFVIIRFVL